MNWETFQDAYNKTTPKIRSLIDSDAISLLLDSLITQGMVSETMRSSLLIIISNYLVGIFDDNSVGKELLGLGMTFEISHRVYFEIEKLKRGQTTTPIPQATLNQEIAEAEHAYESLQAVRTVPQDMADISSQSEVIHQSSQANILQPQASTTPQPASETPRWETQ